MGDLFLALSGEKTKKQNEVFRLLCFVIFLVSPMLPSILDAADTNVLVLGSTKSFSEDWYAGEASIKNQQPFNPQLVANELQSILNGAAVGSANVTFVDIYRSTTRWINGGGSDPAKTYSLQGYFYHPDNREARWDNLKGDNGTEWDYIVLLEDPSILINTPGAYANGVRLIVNKIREGSPQAQPILMMQWADAASSVLAQEFGEVTYRIGDSGDISVSPAGYAWDSLTSKDTGTHPTPHGAYLAAATLYSTIYSGNASVSSYTYDDHLASLAYGTVQDHASQSHYSGLYDNPNPYLILNEKDRVIRSDQNGSSTVQTMLSWNSPYASGRYFQALLNPELRIHDYTEDEDGFSGKKHFHMGRSLHESGKRYKYEPSNYRYAMGFTYQVRNKSAGSDSDILEGQWDMLYGMDVLDNSYGYEYDRGDSRMSFLMIKQDRIADGVRNLPIHALWASVNVEMGNSTPFSDTRHYGADMNESVVSYMMTLLTGRCPIGKNGSETERERQRIGYEHAWVMSTLNLRPPGFTTFPSATDAKTVTPDSMETMEVYFINQPQSSVTVDVTLSANTAALVNPRSLTFNNSNYDTVQKVKVKGLDGSSSSETFDVQFQTASSDVNYDGLNDSWRYTNERDFPISGSTFVEQAAQSLSTGKNSRLSIDLGVVGALEENTTLLQPFDGNVTWINSSNVLFEPNSDYVGVDSFSYAVRIGATVTKGYVVIDVRDEPQLVFVESSGNTYVEESGPTNDTYTLSLNKVPSVDVTVDLTTPDGETTVSPTSLTFTSGDWNVAQSITVTAVVDGTPDSESVGKVVHQTTSGNTSWNGLTNDVFPIILDDDNTLPIASGNSVETVMDTPLAITLIAIDPDIGDSLTYTLATNTANGSLSGTPPNLNYTPEASYLGVDELTFYVNDGTITSNIATVSIVVSNRAVAANTVAATSFNTNVEIPLQASDADGDSLSYTILSNPQNGILSGNGSNRTYTPDVNYSGSDNLTFIVNDGVSNSNTGTVSIHVSGGNLVSVMNHSFEDGGLDVSSQPPWKQSNGSASIKVDKAADLDGKIDPSPDATENYAYSYNSSHSFYQVLSETLEGETRYTLSVDIGDRSEQSVGAGPNLRLGYVSGSPTTEDDWGLHLLEATVVSNTIPVNGAGATDGWERWESTFTTGPSPSGEGEPLRIELEYLGGLFLWDSVRLEKESAAQTVPYVSVVATDPDAGEEGQDPGVWTVSHDGFTVDPLTIYFMLGGTATEDDDYSLSANTSVTIPGGSTNTTVTLTPVDDAVFAEHGEKAELTISARLEYAIVTATDNIIIAENDNNAPVVDAGSDKIVVFEAAPAPNPVAGADVFLDAGTDDGLNATWEANIGTWEPTYTGTVTWVADAGSSLSGITSAYDFVGGGTGGDHGFSGGDGTSLGDLGHDTNPITIEIWFKPDTTSGHPTNGQVLYETGGGTGMGVFYNNGVIETSHDSGDSEISYDVSALVNEFIQVAITYDTGGGADAFKLYVNGKLKSSTAFDDSDMCGGDGAGLGTRGESNVGGRGSGDVSTESFDGKISIFRVYYNEILSEEEILINYNSIAAATAVEVALDGTTSDLDGDTLTHSWSIVSQPVDATATIADNSLVDVTASLNAIGAYVFRLTADDGSEQESDEVTITITDNVSDSIIVENTSVSIGEGSSGNIGLKLSGAPAGNIGFSVSWTSGDGDLSLSGGNNLIFTTSNWSSYQYVQIAVQEDDGDTLSGNAVFSITQISGYGNYSEKNVDVFEVDDDITLTVNSDGNGLVSGGGVVDTDNSPFTITAMPGADYVFDSWSGNIGLISNLSGNSTSIATNVDESITANFVLNVVTIVVESDPVYAPEGSSNVIRVKLSLDPAGDITLGLSSVAGDSDLNLSGGNAISISSANWNIWHEIPVSAAEDDGDTVSGNALYTICKYSGASTVDGTTVDVHEVDDDISLTINVSGNGSVSGGGIFEKSESPFSIIATPDDGSEFVRWSGNLGDITNVSGNSTTISSLANETISAIFQVVLDYDDPVTLIGGAIRNGDFGANVGSEVTFADTDEWHNFSEVQGVQCTKDNLDYDGTQNAVLSISRHFAVNTDHVLAEGDKFDLSYVWRDAWNWVDGSDQVKVSLFVTSDNTFSGTRTNLVQDLSGTASSNDTYEVVDHDEFYTASAGDVGKVLFLVIETDSASGFGRIDNVELIVSSLKATTPGITVSAVSGNTTENGATASFSVVLDRAPAGSVTIGVSSDDTGEVTVAPSSLLFSSGNWNTPVLVTLTGVDDALADGTMGVNILLGAANSSDGSYSGLNPSDPVVYNLDDSVSVTVKTDGNGSTNPAGVIVHDPDDTALSISASANTGYAFASWTGATAGMGNTASANTFIGPTGDQAIMANFSINTYTITFNEGTYGSRIGGGHLMQTVGYGSSATAPTISPDAGYGFTGWDMTFSNVTSDLTITAQYSALDYGVSYDGNGSNGGSVPTDNSAYNIGQMITVLGNTGLLTRTGYTFVDWDTVSDGSGVNYSSGNTFVMGSGNATLYAQWSLNTVELTVSSNVLIVPEGASNSFGVSLSAQPANDKTVNVGFSSGDADQSVSANASMTFTTSNWSVAQNVILQAGEDADSTNGSTTFLVSAVGVTDVLVTGIEGDDDTLQLVVNPGSLIVSEGSTNTISVQLSAEPSADVTVKVENAYGDADIDIIGGNTLVFTSGNWNVPRSFTLLAREDDFDTGNGVGSIRLTATGGHSETSHVMATEADDDIYLTVTADGYAMSTTISGYRDRDNSPYGITATPKTGYTFSDWSLTNGSGILGSNVMASTNVSATSNLTVQANFEINTYTMTYIAGAGGDVNLGSETVNHGADGTAVTATPNGGYKFLNWTGDETSGANPITLTSLTGAKTITANFSPDDLTILSDNVEITEKGSSNLSVALSAQPAGNVDLLISWISGDGDISTATNLLNFTQANWNTAQFITINAADDVDDQNGITNFRISKLSGINPVDSLDVDVTEVDDDVLQLALSSTSLNVHEGNSNDFQIRLSAAPGANVSVMTAFLTGDSDLSVSSGNVLTFTPGTWNVNQTVTISANEDDSDDINGMATLRATATGGFREDKELTVNEVDDEITLTVLHDGEASSITDSGLRDINDSPYAITSLGTTGYTFSHWSMISGVGTFGSNALSSTNIASVGDITVMANFDVITYTMNYHAGTGGDVSLASETVNHGADGSSVMATSNVGYSFVNWTGDLTSTSNPITLTSLMGDSTITANFSLNDLTIVSSNIIVVEGSSNNFAVRLSGQPASDITIGLSKVSGDGNLNISGGNTLTFTTSNWNVDQMIAIDASQDDDALEGLTTFSLAQISGLHLLDALVVDATEADDDNLELIVSPESLFIPEGSSNTVTVSLSQAPGANVRIDVSHLSGDGDIQVFGSDNFVFTPDDWNVPQMVSLIASEDDVDTGHGKARIRLTATGGYTETRDINVFEEDDDIFLTVTDDGKATATTDSGYRDRDNIPFTMTTTPNTGFTLSTWSVVAGSATFSSNTSVITDMTATANVTVQANFNANTYTLGYSAGAGGRVSLTVETVTHGDTGTSVTATPEPGYSFVNWTGDLTTTDNPINLGLVTADTNITSNFSLDTLVVEFEQDSMVISEGGNGHIRVRLSGPPADATILQLELVSGDIDITLETDHLNFTNLNWNIWQDIGVSNAQDDDLVDANAKFSAIKTSGISPVAGNVFTINVNDDDFASYSLSASSITILENGSGNFTAVLGAQPSSNVVVSVMSGNVNDVTVSMSNLIFTMENWNVEQFVTVTGMDNFSQGSNTLGLTVSVVESVSDNAFKLLPDQDVVVVLIDGNIAPVITQGEVVSVIMDEDTTLTESDVEAIWAMDADDDVLTWRISRQPMHGIASVSGIGNVIMSLMYTPETNWNGSDNFIIEVSDGSELDSIRVDVAVSSVNDAPTVTGHVFGLNEYTSTIISEMNLGYSDVEGDSLTHIRITDIPNAVSGTLSLGEVPVEVGDMITLNQLDSENLVYEAASGPSTQAIGFVASDGAKESDEVDIIFNVSDVTPPTITSNYPADGSKVYVNSSIGFGFSEEVVTAEVTNPTNYVLSGDAADTVTVVSVAGSGAGPYTLVLSNDLKAGSLKVHVSGIHDDSGNEMAQAHEVNYTVSALIKVVRNPILISEGTNSFLWMETQSSNLTVTVADNSIVQLNQDSMTLEGLGVGETNITISDDQGNSETAIVRVRSPGLNANSYEFPQYVSGSSYKLMSFPYFLTDMDHKAQLLSLLEDKLGPMSNTSYLLWVYNNTTSSYVRLDESDKEIDISMGYWVAALERTSFDLSAGGPKDDEVVSADLEPGWNLVGNPYMTAMSVGNILLPTGRESIPVISDEQQTLGHHFWYIDENLTEYISLSHLEIGQGAWLYNGTSESQRILFAQTPQVLTPPEADPPGLTKAYGRGKPASEIDLNGEPLPPDAPYTKATSEAEYSIDLGGSGGGGGGGCLLKP